MIRTSEDALVCDLAETYGIFDYRALPASLLATLAVGLRENSRIKMQLGGVKITQETMLLAAAVDKLSLLVWAQTEDARHGRNRPPSVLSILLGTPQADSSPVDAYDTPADFEQTWAAITGVHHGKNGN